MSIYHIQCALFSFSPIPTHETEKVDCTMWESIELSPRRPIIVVGQWETIIYVDEKESFPTTSSLPGPNVFLQIFIQ
jgi:hypothetical protein